MQNRSREQRRSRSGDVASVPALLVMLFALASVDRSQRVAQSQAVATASHEVHVEREALAEKWLTRSNQNALPMFRTEPRGAEYLVAKERLEFYRAVSGARLVRERPDAMVVTFGMLPPAMTASGPGYSAPPLLTSADMEKDSALAQDLDAWGAESHPFTTDHDERAYAALLCGVAAQLQAQLARIAWMAAISEASRPR